MVAPTLADLRYAFFGGGPGKSVSDAEYTQLKAMYDSGRTLASIAGDSPAGLNTGCSSMNRELVTNGALAMPSGMLRLTYFDAPKSFTATKLVLFGGTTAAGATPSLVRGGIYEVNVTTGNLTLITAFANDTGIFNVANTLFTKTLTTPYSVVIGKKIAIGVLVVTAAAAPTASGSSAPTATMIGGLRWKALPPLATELNSQTDLPSSISHAALGNTSAGRMYCELEP